MTAPRFRWSVTVTFEVEAESVELALEAAKGSLTDFSRPVLSVCQNECRSLGSEAL